MFISNYYGADIEKIYANIRLAARYGLVMKPRPIKLILARGMKFSR